MKNTIPQRGETRDSGFSFVFFWGVGGSKARTPAFKKKGVALINKIKNGKKLSIINPTQLYAHECVVKFKIVYYSSEDGNKNLTINHHAGFPQMVRRVEKDENENLVTGRDEIWDLISRVGYAQLKLRWVYEERRGI